MLDEIMRHDSYAVDTEFHRERTYTPHLALVQLAWPGGVALIDVQTLDATMLAALFRSEHEAVLHAADQDLEVLEIACGDAPRKIFDTQMAAGFVGFSSPSLTNLVERALGRQLPKSDRLSDWSRRPLTSTQREYAAADVAHLLDLRDVLKDRLSAVGRLEWARDECEMLRARPRRQQDPDTAWWRMKEARALRGASRGVAQAVAAWRERRAARLDLPVRFVMSDLALLGIAQRRPDSASQLRDVRGVDGGRLRGDIEEEVLRAVATGKSLSPQELRSPPSENVDREARPAVTLASAWIAQLARDLKIDGTLLATRADVGAFLRSEPGARLAAGWRAELVGEPVRRLVSGEAALAFDGEGVVLVDRPKAR